uniref:Proline-rich transmembrane protein 2 n=1 Tax=Oncorhynchus tshawytscha TaxID=74940 RepID=A0AAZ3NNF8_ONCTS
MAEKDRSSGETFSRSFFLPPFHPPSLSLPPSTHPTTGNGMCAADSSPTSSISSPKRLQHAKPTNGRARKGSRSGSLLGHGAGSPRPSISRQPSTVTEEDDGKPPRDYLILAILSCFCPLWPINIVALVFSVMSRNSLQLGNVDGARRLGRNAMVLSIVSLVGAPSQIIIISYFILGLGAKKIIGRSGGPQEVGAWLWV